MTDLLTCRKAVRLCRHAAAMWMPAIVMDFAGCVAARQPALSFRRVVSLMELVQGSRLHNL
jgi:hypothetical protein